MHVRNNKSKKGLTIFLCIILLLSIGLIWQWNNVRAVLLFLRYPQSDISTQLASEGSDASEAVSKIQGDVPDLSDEEKQLLKNGEITSQQAINLILEKVKDVENTPTAPSPSNINEEKPQTTNPSPMPTSPSPAENSDKKRIDELIAELYVLRVTYTSDLDSLILKAHKEYEALPCNEQNDKAKKRLFFKYIGLATSLESECDIKVNTISSELKKLLSKTGGDLSLVDKVKNTYSSEKSLKKAYYMSQFVFN